MHSLKMRLNICRDACRWCFCLLPTYLCRLSDRKDRREMFSHVDMLNSCCCNAEWKSWGAHLSTRSASINISHVQKLLLGARLQFLMKRDDHQSLSAKNIELPLPFTLMANPSRDAAGHFDQARRALCMHHMHPPPRVGCGGKASMT